MSENDKIIKMIYSDGSIPLSYADKIRDALLKTESMKVIAVNYNPPDNDRTNIVCTCPRCYSEIRFEHLVKDIYCEICGQLMTDWDELVDMSGR